MQFIEPAPQGLDSFTDQAAVSFKLGFTWAAQADTAFLTFQMGPAANQARREVLQLGQFNLDLALVALCTLRKNVENQAGAIDHPGI